ncbi:serine-rich adhesin for platelets isoform X2 [Bradysia coprophila]|uniref:serine-rich adhesin for platelets isoform X2 n=1 Tax=Bradysia coprophila TaxID=38358 RepID=UPI00187DAA11|nr:serine-rich adhesin for platelets isoform X2 [Bradysia coprophila]
MESKGSIDSKIGGDAIREGSASAGNLSSNVTNMNPLLKDSKRVIKKMIVMDTSKLKGLGIESTIKNAMSKLGKERNIKIEKPTSNTVDNQSINVSPKVPQTIIKTEFEPNNVTVKPAATVIKHIYRPGVPFSATSDSTTDPVHIQSKGVTAKPSSTHPVIHSPRQSLTTSTNNVSFRSSNETTPPASVTKNVAQSACVPNTSTNSMQPIRIASTGTVPVVKGHRNGPTQFHYNAAIVPSQTNNPVIKVESTAPSAASDGKKIKVLSNVSLIDGKSKLLEIDKLSSKNLKFTNVIKGTDKSPPKAAVLPNSDSGSKPDSHSNAVPGKMESDRVTKFTHVIKGSEERQPRTTVAAPCTVSSTRAPVFIHSSMPKYIQTETKLTSSVNLKPLNDGKHQSTTRLIFHKQHGTPAMPTKIDEPKFSSKSLKNPSDATNKTIPPNILNFSNVGGGNALRSDFINQSFRSSYPAGKSIKTEIDTVPSKNLIFTNASRPVVQIITAIRKSTTPTCSSSAPIKTEFEEMKPNDFNQPNAKGSKEYPSHNVGRPAVCKVAKPVTSTSSTSAATEVATKQLVTTDENVEIYKPSAQKYLSKSTVSTEMTPVDNAARNKRFHDAVWSTNNPRTYARHNIKRLLSDKIIKKRKEEESVQNFHNEQTSETVPPVQADKSDVHGDASASASDLNSEKEKSKTELPTKQPTPIISELTSADDGVQSPVKLPVEPPIQPMVITSDSEPLQNSPIKLVPTVDDTVEPMDVTTDSEKIKPVQLEAESPCNQTTPSPSKLTQIDDSVEQPPIPPVDVNTDAVTVTKNNFCGFSIEEVNVSFSLLTQIKAILSKNRPKKTLPLLVSTNPKVGSEREIKLVVRDNNRWVLNHETGVLEEKFDIKMKSIQQNVPPSTEADMDSRLSRSNLDNVNELIEPSEQTLKNTELESGLSPSKTPVIEDADDEISDIDLFHRSKTKCTGSAMNRRAIFKSIELHRKSALPATTDDDESELSLRVRPPRPKLRRSRQKQTLEQLKVQQNAHVSLLKRFIRTDSDCDNLDEEVLMSFIGSVDQRIEVLENQVKNCFKKKICAELNVDAISVSEQSVTTFVDLMKDIDGPVKSCESVTRPDLVKPSKSSSNVHSRLSGGVTCNAQLPEGILPSNAETAESEHRQGLLKIHEVTIRKDTFLVTEYDNQCDKINHLPLNVKLEKDTSTKRSISAPPPVRKTTKPTIRKKRKRKSLVEMLAKHVDKETLKSVIIEHAKQKCDLSSSLDSDSDNDSDRGDVVSKIFRTVCTIDLCDDDDETVHEDVLQYLEFTEENEMEIEQDVMSVNPSYSVETKINHEVPKPIKSPKPSCKNPRKGKLETRTSETSGKKRNPSSTTVIDTPIEGTIENAESTAISAKEHDDMPVANICDENPPVSTLETSNVSLSTATIMNVSLSTAKTSEVPTSTAPTSEVSFSTTITSIVSLSTATTSNVPPSSATTSNVPTSSSTSRNVPSSTETTSNVTPSSATTSNVSFSTPTTSNVSSSNATTSNVPLSTATTSNVPQSTATTPNVPTSSSTSRNVPSSTETTSNVTPSSATTSNVSFSTPTTSNVSSSNATTLVPLSTATTSNVPLATAPTSNVSFSTPTTSNVPSLTATTSNVPQSTATTSNVSPSTVTTSNVPLSTATTSNVPPPIAATSNVSLTEAESISSNFFDDDDHTETLDTAFDVEASTSPSPDNTLKVDEMPSPKVEAVPQSKILKSDGNSVSEIADKNDIQEGGVVPSDDQSKMEKIVPATVPKISEEVTTVTIPMDNISAAKDPEQPMNVEASPAAPSNTKIDKSPEKKSPKRLIIKLRPFEEISCRPRLKSIDNEPTAGAKLSFAESLSKIDSAIDKGSKSKRKASKSKDAHTTDTIDYNLYGSRLIVVTPETLPKSTERKPKDKIQLSSESINDDPAVGPIKIKIKIGKEPKNSAAIPNNDTVNGIEKPSRSRKRKSAVLEDAASVPVATPPPASDTTRRRPIFDNFDSPEILTTKRARKSKSYVDDDDRIENVPTTTQPLSNSRSSKRKSNSSKSPLKLESSVLETVDGAKDQKDLLATEPVSIAEPNAELNTERNIEPNAEPNAPPKVPIALTMPKTGRGIRPPVLAPLDVAERYVCGNCKEVVEAKDWTKHIRGHYGLSWRVDVDPPIDMDNIHTMSSKVLNFIKKANIKILKCPQCDVEKKSALGYLSHLEVCGLTPEEVKSKLVKCEHCPSMIRSCSMKIHLTFCSGLKRLLQKEKESTKEPDSAEECYNDMGRAVRRSAQKAMSSFKDLGKAPEAKLEDYVERVEKISNKQHRKWRQVLKEGNNMECVRKGCEFSTNDLLAMVDHFNTCVLVDGETFYCNRCGHGPDTRADVEEHIKASHSLGVIESIDDKIFSDSDDDAELGEESSESEGESGDEERSDKDGGDSDFDDEDDDGWNTKGYKKKRLRDWPHNEVMLNSCLDRKVLAEYANLLKSYSGGSYYYPTLEWTQDFRDTHFSSEGLLPTATPNTFSVLSSTLTDLYLPRVQQSNKFLVKDVRKYRKVYGSTEITQSDSWKLLNRFEASIESDCMVLFTGGPVLSMAWLPVPDDHLSQILAVCCRSDANDDILMNNTRAAKCLIQLWNFHKLKNGQLRHAQIPHLLYSVAYDHGPIIQLEFCPSGGFTEDRLGLLAVSSYDGHVDILALPKNFTCDNSKIENLVFTIKPSLTLCCERDRPFGVLMTKLVWSQSMGHTKLAGGFANGLVAIWNLKNLETPFTCSKINGIPTLLPTDLFFAGNKAIKLLEFHHDENNDARWLIAGSHDRKVKFFDTHNVHLEISTTTAHSRITAGCWPVHWTSFLLGIDNAYSLKISGIILKQPLDIGCRTSTFYSCIGSTCDISFNNWLNSYVFVTSYGDIHVGYVRQMISGFGETRRQRSILGYTDSVDISGSDSREEEDVANEEVSTSDEPQPSTSAASAIESAADFSYPSTDGIVFCDFRNPLPAVTSPSYEKIGAPPMNKYNMVKVNRVVFNPNVSAYKLYALGYESGFVRINQLLPN